MSKPDPMFPGARIPYGTWGSSYFPAWQTSGLAEVNIGQFAGEAMARILGMRRVPKSELEYLVIGSTITQTTLTAFTLPVPVAKSSSTNTKP